LKTLLVHSPGTLSLIEDAGRPDLRRFGIPPSGAMDQFSYQVGNLLVGNRPGAAGIEVTLMGLVVEALAPAVAAITGADLAAHLNDEPAPQWTAFALDRGDRICFKRRVTGCRTFLAIRGGIDAPMYFGSRSTFARGRMGAPLRAGDVLTVGEEYDGRDDEISLPGRSLAAEFRPSFSGTQQIRVILGPQDDHFTPRGIETFLGSEYRLSPRSDRQGMRTEGPPIQFAKGPDIISDPTPLGAVQVPGDGQPILLHRDGQSTGGYAKIAIAASTDLDRLGRMAPGDWMRFEAVTADEARTLALHDQERMKAIARSIAYP